MFTRTIEQILPTLVRKVREPAAVKNWALLTKYLSPAQSSQTDENKRALVATVLIETAYTFAPICENGDTDYFTAHYWDDIAVRKALGNVVPTDAIEYHGRGFIQLTGRHNYEKCAGALNLPLMSQPELLLQPEASARACVWFWETHGLPEICNQVSKYKDAPSRERVWRMVRRKVNGGESGFLAFLSLLGALEIR